MIKIIKKLFGQATYVPPTWPLYILNKRKGHAKQIFLTFALITTIAAGYFYYESLPKPIPVKAVINSIKITQNFNDAKPDTLSIDFEYDYSNLKKGQQKPYGYPPVAKLNLIGEEIKSGVSLSPPKKGTWRWVDDSSMVFSPETDWMAETDYTVTFTKEIFAAETRLSDNTYEFSTPDFLASIYNIELYQDPQDISVRRVVSTIKFSHPVDKDSLVEGLIMEMRPSGSTFNSVAKPYNFNITYDKNSREAYIHSEPVQFPMQPNYMSLKISKNVKTILGGSSLGYKQERKVLVPDVYSFLKVDSIRKKIIRNSENEPEQIIFIEFTDDISKKELLNNLSLNKISKQDNEHLSRGGKTSEIFLGEDIPFKVLPNEKSHSKLYSLLIDVPEGVYTYTQINPGLESINKYVMRSGIGSWGTMPNYPEEVDIIGEGSILTYSGNHKLSILTRGVTGLKYSIGKLLEGQLYHFISQTEGDITNPRFINRNFDFGNISELVEEFSWINMGHPKEANYTSIDLSKYMPKAEDRFGLFLIKAHAQDANTESELGIKDSYASDQRLILVTDLGIIVKNNADHTHDLFVQSIQTGKPVSGAKVELLGKNGIPLYTKYTSKDGHISMPSTNDFNKEKTPTVYVVKSKNDISFIPYDRSSRQINLSRFDIGGVKPNNKSKDSLNAYLFTDRGIYRPGEEVTLGMIVKNFDFTNIEGIPLEVIIRGPRHNIVKKEKILLPEKGFFDFKFKTDVISDTGNYQTSLHLVRDYKRQGPEIGKVGFKVEEFQPDTMKIESKILGVKDAGWNNKNNINVKVSLKNLFGTPAQNRKMKGRIVINPSRFSFKEYEGFKFIDPYQNTANKALSLDEFLDEQSTNEDGEVNFNIDLSKFRDGTYALQFIAQGFNQSGGRSVSSQNSMLISPLNQLVGYKSDGNLNYINSNSKRDIEFIAIGSDLKILNLKNLIFKKIEIQNISTLVKQRNGTYKYQSVLKESEVESKEYFISDKGSFHKIDTTTPGNFALEIYDAEERRLTRVSYSVVGHANLTGKIDKNSEMEVRLSKESYKPGEMIEMNIKAPYSGAGLISIETDRVHSYKWFKTSVESTMQSIKLPKNLEGTGYINVAFIRDVGSKEVFASPLSYAVQPFYIDKSKRKIQISLGVEEIVRPGKPMKITYTTSKKSRIAIFAVDEGILQVAKYKEPDPLGHFLKKRSLDVETLQILDLILPDFNLVKELSASGGGVQAMKDAIAKNLNPFSRKVDTPAVYWAGIQDASPDMKEVIFNVPDTFSGALRVIAVAVSEEAVGIDTETTIARGPFVISPNLLTHAAPGDVFSVTVGVANIIAGSGKDAVIDIEVNTSEHLELLDQATKKLNISEGSESKFSFKVKVKNILGAAELTFTARYKNEDAKRTASLSVRPVTPYRTSLESNYEKDGKISLLVSRDLFLTPKIIEQSLSASASPLVLANGLSSYLENFPHGCTEQLVSKVFPILGLMTHPGYADQLHDVESRISYVVSKLRERQMSNGGFSYWPGAEYTRPYPTIYALHFLIEAKDLGYAIPQDIIYQGKQYLRDFVSKPANSISSARNRAKAIYLLTRLGVVTTNYLVDLQESLSKKYPKIWKKDLLSSYMASSYRILQKDKEAGKLISQYKLSKVGRQSYSDFDSLLTQDAQYIFLLSKHFKEKAKVLSGNQILKFTDHIFKDNFNTISASYSILALGAYSKLVLEDEFEENIEFMALSEDDQEQILKAAFKPFLVADYPVNTKQVSASGDKSLFYLNVQSGFDKGVPEEPVKDQLEIHRDFLDDNGNKVTSFAQGEEITVRLKVRGLSDERLTNIAVIDLLPGGFEVIRSSVSRTAGWWGSDYIDIREDRVIYYGSFDNKARELTYKVKLTSEGEFMIPPSYAEAMYDHSIRATSVGGKFTVTGKNDSE